MTRLLILIHLLGAVTWLGGMVFAHFCLRPAAVALLPPPQRLPLMAMALGKFFRIVAVAIVALWGSGLAMLLPVGMAQAPVGWHLMAGLAAVMTVVYALIVHRYYPALKRAVAAQTWPDGAKALDGIRLCVTINLILGLGVLIAASL